MKGNSKAQKKDHRNRGDNKPKVPVCDIRDIPGHQTKDCFHLRTAKAAVANTKRGQNPRRDAVAYNSKKKPRVSVHDSDDESGYNSMVCVEEEVNIAQGMSDVVYLDSGCNKMILTLRKHLQRADRQMTTASKGKLTIASTGNFKGIYYAPEASNNLVDMKSITDKNCTITFDEDEVVIRN